MNTGVLISVVLICLIPTALGYLYVFGKVVVGRVTDRRAAPSEFPMERIERDLRRLHDLLDRTETAADLPAKHQRCVATRAAYLDALETACGRLDVTPPSGQPVSRAEIYRVEADLRRVGLDVRPVG